jgi:hypothetical protein
LTHPEARGASLSRFAWTTASAVATLAVLGLTLRPNPAAVAAVAMTPWWCVVCGPNGGADLLQNLLLLAPVGFCVGRAGWPRRRALLFLVILPVLIEVTQGLAITGRDAALGDVLANAAGGAVGYMIGRRSRTHALSGEVTAAVFLALFALQLLASNWLSTIAAIGPTPWVLHLTPRDRGRPTYDGQVLDAPRPGRHDARWVVTWESSRDDVLTPIARLEDARGQVLTALDRRGEHLGIEVRIHGAALRLRNPAWLLPVPASATRGDTIAIELWSEPGMIRLAARTALDSSTRRVRTGAQHGWTLINPFTPARRGDAAWTRWTLAWLVGWGVLLGWSARGTRRPPWWGAGALALLVIVTAWSHTLASLAELASFVAGWVVAGRFSSGPRTPR